MKKSLLGHLYSHIKGSSEDVATMSLQYLLTFYDSLRISYNELLSDKLQETIDINTSYSCQISGEDNERPDMSGSDSTGKEIVLCEVKFYAGLTENQPLTYLKRIGKEQGFGLVFICPKDRMESFWNTLLSKCSGERVGVVSEYCVTVDDVKMALISWEEILSVLSKTALAVEKESLADLEQLKGYFEQIVSDSFVPFRTEDLGAVEAKKIERIMYVIDRVVDSLCADSSISADTKGVKATPYRHGYKRFFTLNGHKVDLRLDYQAWADDRYIDTPLWVGFRDDDWKTPKDYLDRVKNIHSSRKMRWNREHIYLAVDVPCNTFEEELVAGIKNQILKYLELFED